MNDATTSAHPHGYAPPPAPQYEGRKFAAIHPIKADSAYDSLMNGLGNCLGGIGQFPCCPCFPNPYKEVRQGQIAMVSRFGKYYQTADPGLVKVNPMTERVQYVDTKIQISSIPNLVIVTKDNVSVGIDAVLYWHVIDPYLAVYGVSNVSQALIERTQTTLRAVLGGRDLQDLIENRNTIASDIAEIIDQPAKAWGVTVESILIKDVSMSRELQESLSSAATQKRIGQSKVIQAKAEVEAAQLMREAAEILNTPAAMQIRTLDSMVMMAKAANTKVLFVPVNQDYSNGSINAFGGAGATVGVNAYSSGDDANRTLPQAQGVPGSGNPIAQPVKDSVIYSQLTEM
ncbi:hypothetical protein LPJ70_004286 [Coemansia sp. RSA 2708]|nr:hypothetical protein LPJ70_004286 [Coemansia sp. RSA 2708]KAJ2311901.1 hypothetical protein IWW54_002394 [Coemansia sp. RSA 2705]KAJ2319261.1 hypothetical protein IWW52_002076 [Coemansia sp. RSA 2704]KAJ2327554.1 hypothetical protein IWW51_001685 [Coemansia sp. RSA 2702]KAJ2727797.1 hypothetical protein H4R23_003777 [Coemansia sp. Cherry 401B]